MNISGVAVRAGVSRNNIKYLPEELKSFAPTLSNRPILKDHDARVDNSIGLVTKAFSNNGGEAVNYSGWIKEDGTGVTEKIKDGRIKEVSIGAMATRLVKESDDSDILIAQGLIGLELSLTPTPGVMGTSITHTLENLRNGKKGMIIEMMELPVKLSRISESFEVKPMTEQTPIAEKGCVEKKMADGMSKAEAEKACMPEEMRKEFEAYKSKVDAYEAKEMVGLITEYKQLAAVNKVKDRDVASLSKETLKVLIEDLKSLQSDKTQGRIIQNQAENKMLLTESIVGKDNVIMMEDGIFFERSPIDSRKVSLSMDTSKIKAEGYRWRLGKHSVPQYEA